MDIKQRLATWLPAGKKRRQVFIACAVTICILLCGFSWTWAIEFSARALFPIEDAIDSEMILDFGNVVNTEDLQLYLTDSVIAEQVVNGIQANLSANVYDNIELPDMTKEPLGSKIIRIIFDRLFN